MAQIPQQAMQALQQQQSQGMDITSVLAQLSEMSPDEVVAALAQLGINVAPEQLQKAAADWVDEHAQGAIDGAGSGEQPPVDEAGDDETGDPGAGPPTPSSSPATPTMPDDEEAEGEAPQQQPQAGTQMPRSSNNPIQDIISAQMMESAIGNPNAPVPAGMNIGRQQRPPISAPNAPEGGNAQKQMIAEMFKRQASKGKQPSSKRAVPKAASA